MIKSFLLLYIAGLSLSAYSDEQITENAPETPIEIASQEEPFIPLSEEKLKASNELITAKKSIFNVFKKGEEDGFTINYNNVSITEYLRFVSKICDVNFLYNDPELNFNVTVVSKDPITKENVMATLIQILRIHGLQLLEQDSNLVIHKNDDVKQVATLVTNSGGDKGAPIVTRIFRLKNLKPESIAAIIKPMTSSTALLETSPETRQLILTDITANVNKIGQLIDNLDSPHSLYEIASYEAKHNKSEYLIQMASQLMAPLSVGNTFILVPANLSDTIYIVSTPELIVEAKKVLTNLDIPPKKSLLSSRHIKAENIFVYKLEQRSGEEVIEGLHEIAENLEKSGMPDTDLIESMDNVKWIRETNSILIVGSKVNVDKIKEFIATLDSETVDSFQKPSYFIYTVKNRPVNEVFQALHEVAKNLKETKGTDPSLIHTIEEGKINSGTNTITFSADSRTLTKLKSLLTTVDSTGQKLPIQQNFFVYKIKSTPEKQLQTSLVTFAKSLDKNNPADVDLITTIDQRKYIPESNSIIFTGSDNSIKRLQDILPSFDGEPSGSNSQFLIYHPKFSSGLELEYSLKELVQQLKGNGLADPSLLKALESMKYVKTTNSLLFTGDAETLKKVQDLISDIDTTAKSPAAEQKSNFFLYKPLHTTPDQIEKSLKDVAANLQKSGLADPALLNSIHSVKYIKSTQSLAFTGDPNTITKIQALLKEVDVSPSKMGIQQVGKSTFLLYKIKRANPQQLVSSIKDATAHLKSSKTEDLGFVRALESMKYVKDTHSVMFTGNEESLQKVQSLVSGLDVTSGEGAVTGTASNFYVYKPQSLSGPDLEKVLENFAENLKASGLADPELYRSLETMKYIDKTQSLLFTGTPQSLNQVKELLHEFDIPSNLPDGKISPAADSSIQPIDNTSFLVYKLQFHKGDEIQGALRQIAKDLLLSNAPINQTLLNSINSIQWLEVTNSLLCSGDQETLTRLRELIKNLDIPLKQVFIEMLVLQTSLTNALTFGLEWGAKYKYRDKFSGTLNNLGNTSSTITPSNVPGSDLLNNALTGGTSFPPTSAASGVSPTNPPYPQMVPILGPGFDLGVIGEVIRHGNETFLSIGSLMAALQTDSESTIVMTPKLITQDGRTSTLFQGNNIPYAGSFVSNTGSGSTLGTTNIEYRDVGTNLSITPVLGNSNIVTLEITLDQTSTPSGAVNGQVTFTNTGAVQQINGITTSKTSMQTTVHVPDDHFLILTGMVNASNTKGKSSIPCLGGLPIIGAAFTRDEDSQNNTNLVIFLRPRILNSLDDMIKLTKDQEEFFREQAGSPFLEHTFDEGMELIKSVNDD